MGLYFWKNSKSAVFKGTAFTLILFLFNSLSAHQAQSGQSCYQVYRNLQALASANKYGSYVSTAGFSALAFGFTLGIPLTAGATAIIAAGFGGGAVASAGVLASFRKQEKQYHRMKLLMIASDQNGWMNGTRGFEVSKKTNPKKRAETFAEATRELYFFYDKLIKHQPGDIPNEIQPDGLQKESYRILNEEDQTDLISDQIPMNRFQNLDEVTQLLNQGNQSGTFCTPDFFNISSFAQLRELFYKGNLNEKIKKDFEEKTMEKNDGALSQFIYKKS